MKNERGNTTFSSQTKEMRNFHIEIGSLINYFDGGAKNGVDTVSVRQLLLYN
jgi:hypothetical protein